ncbi:MAG: NlpC/P60 family protein, partial [Eubacteriales bacterium]
ANGLKTDLIYPGQKLLIPTETKTTSKPSYRSVVAQTQQPKLSSRGSTNEVEDNILSTAAPLLGTPYSYGSAGPNSFDCSGFTYYVFNKAGISLPHNAAAQASLGTHVDKTDLQQNDLVFFGYYGSQGVNHVGIYVGGGKFIHASTNEGVRYSSLNDAYYASNYRGARRIL